MRVKDAVGRFGEDVAVRYLEDGGCTVLARNWRCRRGELDIVARDGADLVFVEVKTRSGVGFGTPAAAIDRRKAARIRQLASAWLAETRASDDGPDSSGATAGTEVVGGFAAIRFDVVAVLRPRNGGSVQVDHLRGAF